MKVFRDMSTRMDETGDTTNNTNFASQQPHTPDVPKSSLRPSCQTPPAPPFVASAATAAQLATTRITTGMVPRTIQEYEDDVGRRRRGFRGAWFIFAITVATEQNDAFAGWGCVNGGYCENKHEIGCIVINRLPLATGHWPPT